MAFYAVSMMSVLDETPSVCSQDDHLKKVAFAAGGGSIKGMSLTWEDIKIDGPPKGGFPKGSKSWAIVKPQFLENARSVLKDLNETTEGHEYLGSFIGTEEATAHFVDEKVKEWLVDIEELIEIASFDPHLAYSAYIQAASRRWQFICRTTPGISNQMKPLEKVIRERLIPALIGPQLVTDELRDIFALPARSGGLGIQIPHKECDFEYQNSLIMTGQLTDAIFNQNRQFRMDAIIRGEALKEIRKRKILKCNNEMESLAARISPDIFKILQLCSEKGASIWLTSIPLKSCGFRLSKLQFHDAICTRYNFRPADIPRFCGCGKEFSVNHALTCDVGGYRNMRHDAVRDTFADLLGEVAKDVQTEPSLQPVGSRKLATGANLQDSARADISAIGFWNPLEKAFFDVRVFNPLAMTNWTKEPSQMYSMHEKEKKTKYNERILEIERGTFTPLVFSCSGGAGAEAEKFIKFLAKRIAEKKSEPYAQVVAVLRRRVRFDILRSCNIALRGFRANKIGNLNSLDYVTCYPGGD